MSYNDRAKRHVTALETSRVLRTRFYLTRNQLTIPYLFLCVREEVEDPITILKPKRDRKRVKRASGAAAAKKKVVFARWNEGRDE